MVCAYRPAAGFLRVAGTCSGGQRGTPFGQGLLYYRLKVDASSASMSITNTYFVAFVSVPCYLLECIVYSLHNTNDCGYILVVAGLKSRCFDDVHCYADSGSKVARNFADRLAISRAGLEHRLTIVTRVNIGGIIGTIMIGTATGIEAWRSFG
jgi:hypothetical protein